VLAPDEVLEVRCVSGRLQVARKERHHDEWDRPVEADDPYGPGQVLQVRLINGRLHVARKERHHDEWDRPVEPYDGTFGRAGLRSSAAIA
jgi:hypothetical protein